MKIAAYVIIFLFVIGGFCLGHHMALHPNSSMISVMVMPCVVGIKLAVEILFPKKENQTKEL